MVRVTDGGGLRERKRTAAMYRIQSVALDLFEERGFDTVTVEQIAEASEVSPSSVYRYFGTKEQLVLWDEFDPEMDATFAAALADEVPLVGLRRVMLALAEGMTAQDEARMVRRLRLAMTSPALEQATIATTYTLSELVGKALAERLDRPADDLEVQVFAHSVIGGFLGMFHHWQGAEYREPLRSVLVRTFDIFEQGLDVVTSRAEGPRAEGPGLGVARAN